MSGAHRVFDVLHLFSEEKPVWTVEEAMEELDISISTAYRYFRVLCKEGFLDPIAGAGYVLGPAFIEFDRKIRQTDPLLQVSVPIMQELTEQAKGQATALLCRLYRDKVMCVHQEVGELVSKPLSYDRGLPRPMFRGATSKIILANLPSRTLRQLYDQNKQQVFSAGMGESWEAFKTNLKDIRNKGISISYGELDPNVVGLAVPIMAGERGVLGSLSLVIEAEFASERTVARISPLLLGAAKEIEVMLQSDVPQSASPSRVKAG